MTPEANLHASCNRRSSEQAKSRVDEWTRAGKFALRMAVHQRCGSEADGAQACQAPPDTNWKCALASARVPIDRVHPCGAGQGDHRARDEQDGAESACGQGEAEVAAPVDTSVAGVRGQHQERRSAEQDGSNTAEGRAGDRYLASPR